MEAIKNQVKNRIFLLDYFKVGLQEFEDFSIVLKRWDEIFFRFLLNTKHDSSQVRKNLEELLNEENLSRETTCDFFITEEESKTVLLPRKSLILFQRQCKNIDKKWSNDTNILNGTKTEMFMRIKGFYNNEFNLSRCIKNNINFKDIKMISLTSVSGRDEIVVGIWTSKPYEIIETLLDEN